MKLKIKRPRFGDVVKDILENEEFQKLKGENHHGSSRYDHSVRVALVVCILTKYTTMHYKDYVRAALLHDFFFDYEMPRKYGVRQMYLHPKFALRRAEKHFELSKRQKNMIETHMMPITGKAPLRYGSVLLILVDKIVAIYEIGRFGSPKVAKGTARYTKKTTKKVASRIKNVKSSGEK